jgi:lysine 6-dehydrogenase
MGDSQQWRGWAGAAVFEHERCKLMNILILGAGLQGRACAFDLLEHTDAAVTLTDSVPVELPDFLTVHEGQRLMVVQLDAQNEEALREAIKGADAVMNALPYYFNFPVTKLAVEVGTHYADVGGNTEIVQEQKALHDEAVAKGLSIMPDCGLAPGMANILAAEGVNRFEHARSAKLFVGGLPQEPKPPLNYQVV